MARYFVRRILFALLLVFAVSSASLLLAQLAPGDYATETLGVTARRERIEQMRARYGLDRPFLQQYRDWAIRAARFDFGTSLLFDRPVNQLVAERAINTAVLALSALAVATVLGVPLGVVSGSRQHGPLGGAIRMTSLAVLSLPPLLTSLLLVFIAARTGWLPVGGMESAAAGGSDITDRLWHLVLPTTALALPIAATLERLQAQSVAEVIRQPFVLAAIGRGVPHDRIVWRDALKASLRPTAAVYGLIAGSLLSGSFAVEMVTAWPGLGRLMFDALRARDVYLVAGAAAVGSVFVATSTLISDLALVAVDPRAARHA